MKQVDETIFLLKFEDKGSNSKEYKLETICNIMIYVKKLDSSYLSTLW